MSLSMGYESLGVRFTGSSTTVPDNRLARLMYYLDCVFAVIQYDGAERYTDYHNYYLLSSEEEQTVLGLAALFNPKIMSDLSLFLIGSRFVPSGGNQFYEVTNDKIGFHINSEVMIGGVSRKVLKVMGCTQDWLDRNFFNPVESYGRPRLPASNYNHRYNSNNNDDCECCEIFERCFDSCCSCCDCGCGSTCKRCWCIFLLLYFVGGSLIGIIMGAIK